MTAARSSSPTHAGWPAAAMHAAWLSSLAMVAARVAPKR